MNAKDILAMNHTLIKSLLAVSACAALGACTYDPYKDDLVLPAETLTLSVSGDAIALDEDNLKANVLTFNWTPAREVSDEYIVSYVTKLDVVGNNFGSTTVIRNDEEDGVYSRSFTSEQLDNWANTRWNLPVNKPFTLEFRVVVEFTGGPEFQAPEVRTATVQVTPIHVDIFDADKMSIAGTATSGSEEVSRTVENVNLFAWYGPLGIGELSIPVEFDGGTYYIHTADGSSTIKPGEPVDVVMDETASVWNVPASGNYRVIIDMEAKQVTIYDEATDLQPLTVDFHPNGSDANPLAHVTVTDLWAYGGGTGWGVRRLNCTASAADPQVLLYEGSFSGSVKFCIAQSFTDEAGTAYTQNNAYCYTGDGTLQANKLTELISGATSTERNKYFGMPSGAHLYIFDLRHGTVLAKPVQ